MNHMPPSIAEDFEAIEAAVRETPRGRWFLAEFLRRHQARETRNLLHAVRRLEQTLEREARLGPRIVAALTGTAAAMTARIDTPPPALAEVVSALAEEAETIAAAGDAAKDEETAREAMRDAARRARALAGQLRTLARGIAEIAALCGERTPLAAAEPMVPAETERWFAAAPECFSPAADSAAEADVTVEADHVAAPAA
ncbi:MAG TPA: hypothetical protein ENK13_05685, partial [Thermopetrobacter sp.]|nr:hypothetical protein [Thermopetrobacter sp.]